MMMMRWMTAFAVCACMTTTMAVHANDVCSNAFDLEIDGDVLAGDNDTAGVDGGLNDCPGGAPPPTDGGRWYRIVPSETQEITISTCFLDKTFSFYTTYISVYCGDCGSVECIADSADSNSCGEGPFSSITFCAAANVQYYVLIHGIDNFGFGEAFQVAATGGNACEPFTPCDPLEPALCPWDCAPDNGDGTFGNSTVNVDDLIAVITSFGNPGGPCDVAPDNGDGTFGNDTINVDDLIAIINNFGDCQ
ncbi:MAG: hypothetical protein AAF432_16015 [Planctomycetota bacterium]